MFKRKVWKTKSHYRVPKCDFLKFSFLQRPSIHKISKIIYRAPVFLEYFHWKLKILTLRNLILLKSRSLLGQKSAGFDPLTPRFSANCAAEVPNVDLTADLAKQVLGNRDRNSESGRYLSFFYDLFYPCIEGLWFLPTVERDEKPSQTKFSWIVFMGARDMTAWVPN